MKFELRRIIVFSKDVPALAKWYSTVFGMEIREQDPKWADLDGGGCSLGLHGGGSKRTEDCGHKIVFAAKDVTKAREVVVKRGADFGPVKKFGDLHLCDGKDPEGNILQLSNRL
jgi:predicted enzyme related to lactoylglutathione lyase